MCSRSVLVHCPSRLGAATAVLAAEVRCCDGVLATWARERGHAIDQFDGVMSHSFKCSRLSGHDSEPKFTPHHLSRVQGGICSSNQRMDASWGTTPFPQGRARYL